MPTIFDNAPNLDYISRSKIGGGNHTNRRTIFLPLSRSGTMLSKEVQIINELGLHARCAAKIAGVAGRARANIWLEKEGQKADAASVIDILTLACARGTKLKLLIEDASDLALLNQIAAMVETGFEE